MANNRLKEAVEEAGKDFEWLASRIGCKREHVSRVSTRITKNPGIDFCLRAAHAMGLKVEDLFYL